MSGEDLWWRECKLVIKYWERFTVDGRCVINIENDESDIALSSISGGDAGCWLLARRSVLHMDL